MADRTRTDPKTGVTTTYHLTSGQERLMSKQKWDRTVARAKLQREKREFPERFCNQWECLFRRANLNGTIMPCPVHEHMGVNGDEGQPQEGL